MPLSNPLTYADVSAELRDKAARLYPEMDMPPDPAHVEQKAFGVVMMLAIAMLDAVNDAYDKEWRDTTDPFKRAMYDRAMQLCPGDHGLCRLSGARYITNGGYDQIPIVAPVLKRRAPGEDHAETGYALALQGCLYDMKPLWAQYLWEAREQLLLEKEAADAVWR